MPNSKLRGVLAIVLISVGLAFLTGCGASSVLDGTATPTATIIPSTPTLPPSDNTSFPCPTTTTGATTTLSFPAMHFSFTYPASWTENDCRFSVSSSGEQFLKIGNLFTVGVTPRNGQTLQQWVNTQTTQYEIVTLSPLSVPNAQDAASITAQRSGVTDPRPFDAEPFVGSIAVVAGSQNFYQVIAFVAQNNATDTTPPISDQQLAQQVVSTFVVP